MYWSAHTNRHGDHITVRFFVSEVKERTFAGIGSLTMRQLEWEDLKKRLDLEVTFQEGEVEKCP